MRYPPEHKAAMRRKILREASQAFRERGIDTLGIGRLMRRLGMTHGGFYKHFTSKDALAGEACGQALATSGEQLSSWAEGADPAARLEALLAAYLSPAHRDDRARGCALAALAGELARQAPEVRRPFQEGLGELVHELAQRLEREDDEAVFLLAALVGGLTLARAVAHRKVSARILEACRAGLRSWAGSAVAR